MQGTDSSSVIFPDTIFYIFIPTILLFLPSMKAMADFSQVFLTDRDPGLLDLLPNDRMDGGQKKYHSCHIRRFD